MANNLNRKNIPQNVVSLIVPLVVILLFFLFFIYPQFGAIEQQERRISELKLEIEKQQILYPLYQQLVKKAKLEKPEGLPAPKPAKISRTDIGQLAQIVTQAARGSNFEFEKVLPQVNSVTRAKGLLMVDLSVRGSFQDLRGFLLKMAELPYLEHIERIQIQRSASGDLIGLRLWLALE
jgi:Tfp pilus assembly protein PilO